MNANEIIVGENIGVARPGSWDVSYHTERVTKVNKVYVETTVTQLDGVPRTTRYSVAKRLREMGSQSQRPRYLVPVSEVEQAATAKKARNDFSALQREVQEACTVHARLTESQLQRILVIAKEQKRT